MEELHARFARELLSSAFTRRRLTETRSRSARNATQSFLSNMFSFRKKDGEELRMHFAAPSFFSPIGSCIEVSSPKEARSAIEKSGKCIVVFVPSLTVFSSPRSWLNALSSASLLVVIGDESIKAFRDFMKIADGIVFSPVPRHLSSAYIAKDREKAMEYVKAASDAFPDVLTIKAAESAADED